MDANVANTTNNRLRCVCEEQGISQTKLLAMIHDTYDEASGYGCFSRQTLSKYWHNKAQMKPATAKKLADILHVRVDYLLGYGDHKTDEDEKKTFYRTLMAKDHGVLALLEMNNFYFVGVLDLGTGTMIPDSGAIPSIPLDWMDARHLFLFKQKGGNGTSRSFYMQGNKWASFQLLTSDILTVLFKNFAQEIDSDVTPAATN